MAQTFFINHTKILTKKKKKSNFKIIKSNNFRTEAVTQHFLTVLNESYDVSIYK